MVVVVAAAAAERLCGRVQKTTAILKFSGMRVMGRPTRPLPVPGPWGLPGPYRVYAGTMLKTKIDIVLDYKIKIIMSFVEGFAFPDQPFGFIKAIKGNFGKFLKKNLISL